MSGFLRTYYYRNNKNINIRKLAYNFEKHKIYITPKVPKKFVELKFIFYSIKIKLFYVVAFLSDCYVQIIYKTWRLQLP